MNTPQTYMHRCLMLAKIGAGHVAPNPMVGAVLVHDDRIIGEGYHRAYGGPHAEVNCIDSVPAHLRHLFDRSTMYVSLEPCAHFGKTPPCADLLIRHRIPKVMIGCRDPFKQVNGRGIDKLQTAGIEVVTGVLEDECTALNKRFFTFHTRFRPYVILKWAQTGNGRIGYEGSNRLQISGPPANRLVHKWRSEEASIMVGTRTAAMDNPRLTNRLWSGATPVRLVVDMGLRLPPSLHLFDGSTRTIVFNGQKEAQEGNIMYCRIAGEKKLVEQITAQLYRLGINSVFVEGGAQLLQSFIDAGVWDEARVLTNPGLMIPDGVAAPVLTHQRLESERYIGNDRLSEYFRN